MEQLIGLIFIAVLATFAGAELIGKVPPQLHTPLMSGSNAISGITIVGSLLAAAAALRRPRPSNKKQRVLSACVLSHSRAGMFCVLKLHGSQVEGGW